MIPLHLGGRDRSLARRLSGALIVVALLIAITLSTAATAFVLVLGHYEPSVSQLIAGRDAVDQLRNGMVDEETGLRGYLDSGDPSFLQPYTAGQQEIRGGEEGSVPLATRDDLAGPMLRMRLAERAWLDEWATPALAVPGRAPSPTQRYDFLRAGKRLFDSYRAAQGLVDQQVTSDIKAEQAAEHNVLAACLAVVGIAVVVTTVVATLQHRALRAAMVGPVENLLATMRKVRGGDLAARPAVVGPPELREVATALGEMTDALVAERSRIAGLEAMSRDQAAQLQLIVAVAREISGSLNLRYVAEAVASAAMSITGFERARVWLDSDHRGALTPLYDSDVAHGGRVELSDVRLGEGLVGRAGQYGRIMSSRPDGSVVSEHRPDLPAVSLAIPMIVAGRVIGVVELLDGQARLVDQGTLDIMRSLAGQGATAMEATRLHHRAEVMSHTDQLTGLPNRRKLESDLETEVARSLRYQRPLAFIMLDIDHFKAFNDLNGHQAGDEILTEFGRSLADGLRDSDTAYRYGGEEFSVLLRETDAAAALVAADRLRARIAERFATLDGAPGVTVSLGIAALSDGVNDVSSLVAAADRAMYGAKQAGRNRVMVAAPPTPRRARHADRVATGGGLDAPVR